MKSHDMYVSLELILSIFRRASEDNYNSYRTSLEKQLNEEVSYNRFQHGGFWIISNYYRYRHRRRLSS